MLLPTGSLLKGSDEKEELSATEMTTDSESDEEGFLEELSQLAIVQRNKTVGKAAPPSNLGTLGEEWAFAWLKQQKWVKPGTLVWLNERGEAHDSHDFECVSLKSPGRRHIEVKTRWRRFKGASASARQRERVLDPEDDYLLLIIGFFENVFQCDPIAPQVRLLPNAKWEDKQLKCLLCQKYHMWTIEMQKGVGIRSVLDRQEWPQLCKACRRKTRRNGTKVVICRDCEKPWTYTRGEQKFIKRKGFTAPKRCKPCRKKKREKLIFISFLGE